MKIILRGASWVSRSKVLMVGKQITSIHNYK